MSEDTELEHDAELMLLRCLVFSLFDEHPNKDRVLARFRGVVEGLGHTVPDGTDPELLVEIRARMQVYLHILDE